MKRSKVPEEKIIYALKQAEAGTLFQDVSRQMGVSTNTFYLRTKECAGLGVR